MWTLRLEAICPRTRITLRNETETQSNKARNIGNKEEREFECERNPLIINVD